MYLFFVNIYTQFYWIDPTHSCDKLVKLEQNDFEKLPCVLPSESMLILSSGMVGEVSKEETAKDVDEDEDTDEGTKRPKFHNFRIIIRKDIFKTAQFILRIYCNI